VKINSQLRSSAPLLDAYLAYFEGDFTPFTIPGHKQRASKIDPGLGAVVDTDIPLYGGLDEIKLTNQVLKESESLAAQLWGADFARFSTGGSTHANQALILALGKPGDKVALKSHCAPFRIERSCSSGLRTNLVNTRDRCQHRCSTWNSDFRARARSRRKANCASTY
jgi:hypothetical protein